MTPSLAHRPYYGKPRLSQVAKLPRTLLLPHSERRVRSLANAHQGTQIPPSSTEDRRHLRVSANENLQHSLPWDYGSPIHQVCSLYMVILSNKSSISDHAFLAELAAETSFCMQRRWQAIGRSPLLSSNDCGETRRTSASMGTRHVNAESKDCCSSDCFEEPQSCLLLSKIELIAPYEIVLCRPDNFGDGLVEPTEKVV